MANAARRLDRSDDPAQAHERNLWSQDLLQLRGRFHAILQRKNSGRWRQERAHRTGGFAYLPGLHRENDAVNWANVFRFVTRLGDSGREIALGAQNSQPVPADGFKSCRAGHHRNRIPGPRQDSRKVPANSASADYCKRSLIHRRLSTIAVSQFGSKTVRPARKLAFSLTICLEAKYHSSPCPPGRQQRRSVCQRQYPTYIDL